MSVLVYSFAKSGNFLAARALVHMVEGNIFRCLVSRHIRDVHRRSYIRPQYLDSFGESFGDSIATDLYALFCGDSETEDAFVYKTHAAAHIADAMDSLDGIIVLLRRPTDIVKSHVAFQFLGVPKFDGDLRDHSIFVYNDQRNYMDRMLTLRPCLALGHDGYMDAIFNALRMDKPIFFYRYDEIARNPAAFCRNTALNIYGHNITLPDEFNRNLSKDNFLAMQEAILDFFIAWEGWGNGILSPSEVSCLTKWAYDNKFRVINGHPDLSGWLRGLPAAENADAIHDAVAACVPTNGLLLADAAARANFREELLDLLCTRFFHMPVTLGTTPEARLAS